MATLHRHKIAPHQPGSKSVCPGQSGTVISCTLDMDDIYDQWFDCVHSNHKVAVEDQAADALASAPAIPDREIGFGIKNSAFGKWSDGTQTGDGNMYGRIAIAMSKSPFFSTTIPCNPDNPGQVHVQESTTRSVSVTAQIGSGAEAAIQASLGVTVSESKTLTIDQVFPGEKCRTLELDIHIKYEVHDILWVTPTMTLAFCVAVPIGWHPIMRPVPPSCCRKGTAKLIGRLFELGKEMPGEAGYALVKAGKRLGRAQALLEHSTDFVGVLTAYEDAAMLMVRAGSLGLDNSALLREALDLADQIAAAELDRARDCRFLSIDWPARAAMAMAMVVPGFELLALARDYRNEKPASAMHWYRVALEYAAETIEAVGTPPVMSEN